MRESLGNIFEVPENFAKRRVTLPHIRTVDLDEALSRLGTGRFNYVLIFLAGITLTVSSYETIAISFVFPVAQCDLKLTTQQKGILSGVTSMGIILSSYLWGFYSDYKGRKYVIVPTLFLTFLSTALSSLAPNYEVLLIFRFISGFFVAGSSATIYAYVSEFHCCRNRSKILIFASVINGAACNYLAIVGYFLLNRDFSFHVPVVDIEYKAWRMYLFACGLPSFFCAIGLMFFPESPKFLFSKGREEKTLKILRDIYAINHPKNPDAYNVTKLVDDAEFNEEEISIVTTTNPILMLWNQTKLLFSREHFRKTTLICTVQFLMFASCHGLYMFFPEIIDQVKTFMNESPHHESTICKILKEDLGSLETDDDENSISNATFECNEKLEVAAFGYSLLIESLYMVGFLIIAILVNRVSKLSLLLAILFGCAASGSATLWVTKPLVSNVLYVFFVLTMLAVNLVCAATCNLYPTKLRGVAVNVSMMFGRIGSVVGTFVVGRTLDDYCELTFGVSAGLMFVCGFLCIFIPKIRKIDGRK